jgi:hypothetical protein
MRVMDFRARITPGYKSKDFFGLMALYGNEVCSCCGADYQPNFDSIYNKGLTFVLANTPNVEETEDYWTESVPVGTQFLNIRHRKDIPSPDEDEDDGNYDYEWI